MKNKKALLVFSHQLTENQEKELVEEYGVKEIEHLPEELQNMWSNVSIKKDYKDYSYSFIAELIMKHLISLFSQYNIIDYRNKQRISEKLQIPLQTKIS